MTRLLSFFFLWVNPLIHICDPSVRPTFSSSVFLFSQSAVVLYISRALSLVSSVLLSGEVARELSIQMEGSVVLYFPWEVSDHLYMIFEGKLCFSQAKKKNTNKFERRFRIYPLQARGLPAVKGCVSREFCIYPVPKTIQVFICLNSVTVLLPLSAWKATCVVHRSYKRYCVMSYWFYMFSLTVWFPVWRLSRFHLLLPSTLPLGTPQTTTSAH